MGENLIGEVRGEAIDEPGEKVYPLPGWLYQVLKWLCIICLPAVGWAYGELAPDWGLPMAGQVVHTLDVAGTLIGVLIGASQLAAKEV